MSNEELIITGEIVGSMERPKAIDPNDRTGTEEITPDEIRLPRLAIAQGLSPQLVPGEGQHIKGLSIGEMFNDVSEDIYGNGPLMLIPVKRHVTRIEFDPLNKQVPLDRHVPANDERMLWHGDEPPRATEFVEFTSILLRPGKAPEGVVMSIKTTNKEQRRAADLFTTYIATRSGPIFSGLYRVSSKIVKGKNKEGQDTMYGVFIVKNAGYVPADTPVGAALLKHAKEFHDGVAGKIVETNREGGPDDTDFDPEKLERESR